MSSFETDGVINMLFDTISIVLFPYETFSSVILNDSSSASIPMAFCLVLYILSVQ